MAQTNSPSTGRHRGLGTDIELRRVVVPLDGTAFAEAALHPAAEIASRAGGTLHLVTAVQRGAGKVVTIEPIPPDALSDMRRAESAEAHLDEVRERIQDRWDCDVSTEVLGDARPSEALARFGAEIEADLFVAATHSRGLVERTLLGSTAADLVRDADCPTLLVPSNDPEPDPDDIPLQGRITSVAVALDPEADESDAGLEHAVALCRLLGADLSLVQVALTVPAPSAGAAGTPPVSMKPGLALDLESRKKSEDMLQERASALREEGLSVSWRLLEGPDVSRALAAFVEESDSDILVMGRHERSLLDRVWRGSESDRVHRRIRTSGLLVCPETPGSR